MGAGKGQAKRINLFGIGKKPTTFNVPSLKSNELTGKAVTVSLGGNKEEVLETIRDWYGFDIPRSKKKEKLYKDFEDHVMSLDDPTKIPATIDNFYLTLIGKIDVEHIEMLVNFDGFNDDGEPWNIMLDEINETEIQDKAKEIISDYAKSHYKPENIAD